MNVIDLLLGMELRLRFGGYVRDLDSDSKYGEYPCDVGELAKWRGTQTNWTCSRLCKRVLY